MRRNTQELGVDSLFLGKMLPKYKKYQVWRGGGQIVILLGVISLLFNIVIGFALLGIGFCVYMIGQHYIRYRDSKQFADEVLAFAKSDSVKSGFAELCGFYIAGIVQYKTSESKASWPQKPSLILSDHREYESKKGSNETKNQSYKYAEKKNDDSLTGKQAGIYKEADEFNIGFLFEDISEYRRFYIHSKEYGKASKDMRRAAFLKKISHDRWLYYIIQQDGPWYAEFIKPFEPNIDNLNIFNTGCLISERLLNSYIYSVDKEIIENKSTKPFGILTHEMPADIDPLTEIKKHIEID